MSRRDHAESGWINNKRVYFSRATIFDHVELAEYLISMVNKTRLRLHAHTSKPLCTTQATIVPFEEKHSQSVRSKLSQSAFAFYALAIR